MLHNKTVNTIDGKVISVSFILFDGIYTTKNDNAIVWQAMKFDNYVNLYSNVTGLRLHSELSILIPLDAISVMIDYNVNHGASVQIYFEDKLKITAICSDYVGEVLVTLFRELYTETK